MNVNEGSEKAGLKLSIKKREIMADSRGKSGISDRFSFLGLQDQLQMVTAAMKLKDTYSLEGNL